MSVLRKFNFSAPTAAFFRENRTRVIQRLLATGTVPLESFILLCGPTEQAIYDDDMHFGLAPEHTFYHLMGIVEPNTYGLIDVQNNFATLFVKLPDAMKTFWEKSRPKEHFLDSGKFDEVLGFDALKGTLAARLGARRLFLFAGRNPFSGREIGAVPPALKEALEGRDVDSHSVFGQICEERVRKSTEEQRLLKQCADLAVLGHVEMIRSLGQDVSELNVAHRFQFALKYLANADYAFETVVAAGPNAQFHLHVPSEQALLREGQVVVLNAGARLCGYSSDIARTLPVASAFSARQAEIYEIVLRALTGIFEGARPGVAWRDISRQAERKLLEGMLSLGLLRGDVDMLEFKRVIGHFLPEPMGTYIGLYRHDLPGLPELEHIGAEDGTGPRVLRSLEKDMVLAVGVGIYFNDLLIQRALEDSLTAEHIEEARVRQYQAEMGAVYIKDQILITLNGCEVLTEALPRNISDLGALRDDKNKLRGDSFDFSK